MFTNVVVAIAEPDAGADAVALARRLAHPDAQITLAHVFLGDEHVGRAHNADYDAAQRETAIGLLSEIRAMADLPAALTTVGAASVGGGLHRIVDAAQADLLVVGSSRRGLIGRVLMGDDTREALNGASCAVAVAPVGYARLPVHAREIGVGYNGSAESRRALAVARVLAAQWKVKLSAFQTVSVPNYMYMGPITAADQPLEELVAEARRQIEALGVEGHAAYGRPSEELTLYSASLDLLVLGAREFGPIGRLMHGSTSRRLAHSSRCPLLVLTRSTARLRFPEGEEQTAARAAAEPAQVS